jgi:hypothetical protein
MGYAITEDDYFQKQQPAKSEELINIVDVSSLPLDIGDWKDELYRSRDPITFTSLQTQTIEIKFTAIPARAPAAIAYITDSAGVLIKNATTGKYSNSLMSIVSTYYAWGASCVITNPVAATSYCKIVCGGYPLEVNGKRIATANDTDSILENGDLKYTLQDNHLIQDYALAQQIALVLIENYSTPLKDISLSWRGNMAMQLQDEIDVPEYNKNGVYREGTFNVFKMKTEYDGGLRQATEGRKINLS